MPFRRPRVSLRLKTTAFVSAVMVGSAVSLGTAVQRVWVTTQRQQFEAHAQARVHAAAAASQYGALAHNTASLDAVLEGLRREQDVLYAIVEGEEGVLAQSGHIPANVSAARLAAIERSARATNGVLLSPLVSTSGGIGDLEVAVPIYWERPAEDASPEALVLGLVPKMEQERVGVIRAGFSVDQLKRQQAESRRTITRLTFAITSVAVLLAALLSGLIITPIRRLAAATRQVAAGDLTIRVPVGTGDEIGALAEAFNLMTDDLQASHEELNKYQRTLEFQVAERTDALRMANEELRSTNDALAQANRLKSEFLANMSHELRTPLNAIIGFSELLTDQVFGPLNDKQSRYVENVLTSGRHLLNLINEILDLAKVESGKMELNLEPFSPEASITDVTNMVRPLADKKSLTLRMESVQPLGLVVADPKRVKQILYNLLSNAIKFTPEDGTVTVRTNLTPPGPTPKWWEVAVHDTGIGIAPNDQARIFNEFEQVDGTHAREFAGTGLGLALTRRLIEMHGGTLSLESILGEGSTFTMQIPLKRLENQGTEAAAGPATAAYGSPVLYAGAGSDALRGSLDAFLRDHGFPVHWLDAKADVVRWARELRPGAIVLDLTEDPAAVYRRWHALRADAETSNIPTILIVTPEIEAEGFALCAAAHLAKPVDRDDLLARLQTLLPDDQSRPARILIVDDDPQYLELTRDLLRHEGYDVHVATDGAAGIEAMEQYAPDVVLLDLMMPNVNGFEVVAHMRSSPDTATIPIVVITAKDLTSEDVSALNGHVASIAQKGLFSREDLLREITRAYSRALARR